MTNSIWRGKALDVEVEVIVRAVPIAGLAASVLLAGALSACDSAATAGSAGPAQTITLYNGQHLQTAQALAAAFTKQSGIRVSIRSDDEDVLGNQIVSEGSRSPADVFYTENSPVLQFLQGKGLLAPVDQTTLGTAAARFSSEQGDWLGVSARVSVIIYNPGLIAAKDLPTSVLQLAAPRYKGKLGLAASETDFQPIVTSVLRTYGSKAAGQWLDGIKANAGGHDFPDNETLANQVNRGTVAFGVLDQYYWYRLRAEIGAGATHSRLAYFAPQDPGYVLDVSGAALLKSSAHKAAAQKFLAFLDSRAGQEIIAHSDSFEYPIASGVTTAAPETPFGQLKPNAVTITQLGDGSSAIAALRQAGLL
jgi:iron(III) transport system substrate-binding protein